MSELGPELEPLEVLRGSHGGGETHPRPAAAPRPPRRVRRVVVTGVAGVFVLSAVAAVARDDSNGSEPDRAPVGEAAGPSWTGAPKGDEPAPPGWRRGAPGPLRPRQGHVAVWTGSALVVWGGDPSDDGHGAAYHPTTNHWRPIASAPFSARRWPAPVAVWTGFEMLVWGGQEAGPAAAVAGAYDPIADRWRTLATSPLAARAPLAGVWTGEEFVVAGGTADGRRFPSPEAAAYDPAGDRWRQLPPMPVALTDAVGLWTGSEVVILGSALGDGNHSLDPEKKPRAAAYNPASDRWRLLAPPPLSPQATTAVWTGDQIVAWDYNLRAVALDPDLGPSARWSALPDLPLDFTECYPTAMAAGDVVFAEHCGQGAVYRPSTGTWVRVPHPRQLSAEPVWTGEELLFWVGRYDASADGLWRFRPPPPRPVGPVPPVLGAKRR